MAVAVGLAPASASNSPADAVEFRPGAGFPMNGPPATLRIYTEREGGPVVGEAQIVATFGDTRWIVLLFASAETLAQGQIRARVSRSETHRPGIATVELRDGTGQILADRGSVELSIHKGRIRGTVRTDSDRMSGLVEGRVEVLCATPVKAAQAPAGRPAAQAGRRQRADVRFESAMCRPFDALR
jgi:hypothetical protein